MSDYLTYVKGLGVPWEELGTSFTSLPVIGLEIAEAGATAPWVFIQGGIHGTEWTSAYYTAQFMSWLANGNAPKNAAKLATLKSAYNFYCIPNINPSGYVANTRGNTRTGYNPTCNTHIVDINRNYSYGWEAFDECAESVERGKGPSVYSESETAISRAKMVEITPVMVFDGHALGAQVMSGYYHNRFGVTKYNWHVRKVFALLKAEMPEMEFAWTAPNGPLAHQEAYATAPAGVVPYVMTLEPGGGLPAAQQMRNGLNMLMYALWLAHADGLFIQP